MKLVRTEEKIPKTPTVEEIRAENEELKEYLLQQDLDNKEALAELYMLVMMGGM